MSDVLLVEHADGVTTLTMNRPASLNSLDVALKEALAEELFRVAADRSIRALVLAGAGRAFCVGQDLREHATGLSGDAPLDTVTLHYNPIVRGLAELPIPVVAAVRGVAAGAGAGLAMLADFRIGGPGTSFLMAFAKVGLAGDSGVSWTLPRLVGHAKATELLMLAESVPAAEAARLGLLTRLVEDDEQVLPAAQELAGRLGAGPTVAFAEIKKELLHGANGTLTDALIQEAHSQKRAGATADHRAATEAFLNKQRPTFTGQG